VSEHEKCREQLEKLVAETGVGVIVSSDPLHGPYGAECMVCPHGTPYWIHPTLQQAEQWKQDGTP
jgi:hypothetical protein